MKKLMIGAAALLFTTGAFAQNSMSGSSARFGLKAGVNLATYSGTGSRDLDYKTNVGYSVTGYGDFAVGNNFFIQPGISLQNKGAKLESVNTNGGATTTRSLKQDVMALEIPINAVIRIPTGDAGAVQISAGPYIGFNLSGKNKGSASFSNNFIDASSTNDTDLKFGSSSTDDLNTIDFGANVGLAYRLNSGLSIGANYGLGIANLVPKDNVNSSDKLRNRVIGITIGYSL